MDLFVNKQLLWWSASITLDNNKDVLTGFKLFFFTLYTLPHTSVGLTSCTSIVVSVLNISTHLTTVLPVVHFKKLRNSHIDFSGQWPYICVYTTSWRVVYAGTWGIHDPFNIRALEGGSPMSHVDFKKWQSHSSLSVTFLNVTCRI